MVRRGLALQLAFFCFLVGVSGMTEPNTLTDELTQTEVTSAVLVTSTEVADTPSVRLENNDVYKRLILYNVALLDDQTLKLTFELEEIWNGSKEWITSSYGSKVMLKEIGDLKIIDSKARVFNETAIQITRMEVSVPCALDYFYYPFDKHICAFSLIHGDNSDLHIDTSNTSVRLSSNLVETGNFHLTHFKVNATTSSEDPAARFSGISLQLLLLRPRQRSFSIVYFPVMGLMMISCFALFLKSTIHAIYITLISFVAIILWIGILELVTINSATLTMLDHYNLMCLNFSLNNVLVSFMIHLFLQHAPKSTTSKLRKVASEASVIISPIKLELQSVSSNGNIASSTESHEDSTDSKDPDDPEFHIHKMGKLKRFIYFKGCKPAKYQVPVMFTIINVIYWIWIFVVILLVPAGFQPVGK